jgi:hypothetical protein
VPVKATTSLGKVKAAVFLATGCPKLELERSRAMLEHSP